MRHFLLTLSYNQKFDAMMKVILTSVMMLMAVGLFAQKSQFTNEYYTNGTPKAKYEFIGNHTYQATYYFEDGTVREEGYFRSGKTHGLWISYNEDGKVIREGYFNNDKKDGKWRNWNDEGALLGEVMYLDDILMAPDVAEK